LEENSSTGQNIQGRPAQLLLSVRMPQTVEERTCVSSTAQLARLDVSN